MQTPAEEQQRNPAALATSTASGPTVASSAQVTALATAISTGDATSIKDSLDVPGKALWCILQT